MLRIPLVLASAGVLWYFLLGPLTHIALAALAVRSDVKSIRGHKRPLQNLVAVLPQIDRHVDTVDRSMGRLGYWSWVPFAGGVYRSLNGLVTAASYEIKAGRIILPPLAKYSASSKILATVVAHLPTLRRSLIAATPEFRAANRALAGVRPAELGPFGANTVNEVATLQHLSANLTKNVKTVEADLPLIQNLLGIPSPQRYWLVFENSGELRPTGGFMTAYGDTLVSQGKIKKIITHNIYGLYLGTTYRPAAPPMFTYAFGVRHWHIEDANTSPDVPLSVGNIYTFYNSIPFVPKPLNGVGLITTWFVDRLIGDVGAIHLGAPYNVTITQQNANYEMEYLSEKAKLPKGEHKAFIKQMIHVLLHRIFHGSPTELLRVAGTVDTALNQKLLLFYFNNPQAEALLQRYDWGGIIPAQVPSNGNYLQEVDENLGGRKDNYYLKEAVTSTIVPYNSSQYQETVSIHWTNPAIANHWTVAQYQAWARIYVPAGSQLLSSKGWQLYPANYANNTENKQVFGGLFKMPVRKRASAPPATWTMTFRYLLPPGTNVHTYLIQKQPGVLSQRETVILGRHRYSFNLSRDTLLRLTSHGWVAHPYY